MHTNILDVSAMVIGYQCITDWNKENCRGVPFDESWRFARNEERDQAQTQVSQALQKHI